MAQDIYWLPRSETEAQRLDEQSLVFERALDYQIHPSILESLPSDSVVADVGTGTGDYLARLSKRLPQTCVFHGFDISAQQFHPKSKLPSNVELHVQDVKKPFPTHFHNMFDVVHLRMLVAGMDEQDWSTAVSNLLQILKPGGAIQWEEGDFITQRRIRGGPVGTTAKNLIFALQPMTDLYIHRLKFGYSTLQEIFEAHGMQRIEDDIVSSDRVLENREAMTRLSIVAVISWAKKMRQEGNDNKSVDFWGGLDIEEVERKAYDDLSAGAYSRFDIHCFVGFKPQ